jgi:ribose transport system substrate-binding protein
MRKLMMIVGWAASLGLGALFNHGPALAASAEKRVALLVGPAEDKYLGTFTKTFNSEAAAKGIKVTTFSSPFDPALQAQQVDDAIAQKFDMLVVQTISQKAIVPALTRAKAAKIPVLLVIAQFPSDENSDLYVSYVGAPSNAIGAMAGEALVRALTASGRKQAKVAILAGSMDEGIAPMRVAGFREALAKHPEVEVVQVEDTMWQPQLAERDAGQLLARFAAKGGLDGVYGMNDSLANGAVQAANSAGVAVGTGADQLIVVGGNCQGVGVKDIKSGKMAASILMLPTQDASLAVEKAVEFFDGKDIGKANYTPIEIITKDNIEKYSAQCSY